MKSMLFFRRLPRRLVALATVPVVLWAVFVSAGSASAGAAWQAMTASLPLQALRWELGDLWPQQEFSTAMVMALRQSPLLLSARYEIAQMWRQEEPSGGAETQWETLQSPIREESVDPTVTPDVDNGVAAKTLLPTDLSGYTVCGTACISNSTDYILSISDLQEDFAARLTPEAPQVLILHTHGSEAYTPAAGAEVVWSGDHRTTDSRYNVVRAGDAIAQVLGEAGISVLHDRTLYDYPNYAGAYDRSLAAIESYLAQYPSISFILDVHRDAIADTEGNQYKVLSASDGTLSQMTLVVGSDGGGAAHDDWMENLRLAVALQQQVLTADATVMRPILLRNSRYNQHATTGSLLLEVGAAGNAPEEAEAAARLFAAAFVEVLQGQSK